MLKKFSELDDFEKAIVKRTIKRVMKHMPPGWIRPKEKISKKQEAIELSKIEPEIELEQEAKAEKEKSRNNRRQWYNALISFLLEQEKPVTLEEICLAIDIKNSKDRIKLNDAIHQLDRRKTKINGNKILVKAGGVKNPRGRDLTLWQLKQI